MSSAKKVILPGVFTALLLGGQLALSGISGVEVVTVLLLSFTYYFGIVQGLFVANAFSLLRCFIFGFYPVVILLYLIYYNLFVVIIGLLGKAFNHEYSLKKHLIVIVAAVLLTASFTMIDNILTPLMYAFNLNATKAYFIASLPTLFGQCICTSVTVSLLFPVLVGVLKKLNL